MLQVYINLLGSMTFWLLSILVTVAALLPDYTLKVCKSLSIKFGPIMPGTGNWRRQKSQKSDIEVTSL